MDSFGILAQALGVAYAAGLNVPATVAILGLAQQRGWIGHLPAGLDVVAIRAASATEKPALSEKS